MIEFKCPCGRKGSVGDRFAGKLVRCPTCGQQLRIPNPAEERSPVLATPPVEPPEPPLAPSSELPPHPSRSANQFGDFPPAPSASALRAKIASASNGPRVFHVVVGGLMLATLLLPWLVVEKHALMSWDLLSSGPTSVRTFLTVCWVIGLATVVLTFALRGVPLYICYAALGAGGLVLLLIMALVAVPDFDSLEDLGDHPFGGGVRAQAVLTMVFLLLIIIISEIRLRIGARLPVRIIQGIAAGCLLILEVIAFVVGLAQFADLPQVIRDKLSFDATLFVLLELAVLAACVIGLVHAAAIRLQQALLTRISLWMLYSCLVVAVCYILVRPAAAADHAGLMLSFLNTIFLTGGVLVLFASGIVLLITETQRTQGAARNWPSPETPSFAASPGTPEARLEELASFMRRGLISPEEYVRMKQDVLAKMQ